MPILIIDRKLRFTSLAVWNVEGAAAFVSILQPDDASVADFAILDFIGVYF
jgi:hypothetical protein